MDIRLLWQNQTRTVPKPVVPWNFNHRPSTDIHLLRTESEMDSASTDQQTDTGNRLGYRIVCVRVKSCETEVRLHPFEDCGGQRKRE